MAKYRTEDEVTYTGHKDVYRVVNVMQHPKVTYYILEDPRGNRHECHQPSILRLHRRCAAVRR